MKVIGGAYGCSVLDAMESAPKHEMSEAFAMFNFQELCLMLDCKYGLKPEHNTDTGIEPDFRLEKAESFYDRPALVEYLHDLK